VPLGGAAFRGYDPRVAIRDAAAVNAELLLRLGATGTASRPLALWATVWGDIGGVRLAVPMTGGPDTGASVGDGGIGLALKGWIYDREISIRLDAPVYLSHPALAVGDPGSDPDKFGPRWQITFGDVW
jgi:hypothetical protein